MLTHNLQRQKYPTVFQQNLNLHLSILGGYLRKTYLKEMTEAVIHHSINIQRELKNFIKNMY